MNPDALTVSDLVIAVENNLLSTAEARAILRFQVPALRQMNAMTPPPGPGEKETP